MRVRFERSVTVAVDAARLFEIITDYESYPAFVPAVATITVVARDDDGVEVVVGWTTRLGRESRFWDRYTRGDETRIERRLAGNEAAHTAWTIQAVDAGHATLTLTASLDAPWIVRLLLAPMLARAVDRANLAPFVAEALRRHRPDRP
jgi:ribosome-associated toxin RatA of RatAB toxin-antitoxin module